MKYTEKSCSIISFGCPKNLVDSETMVGRLIALGYNLQYDPDRAELVLLNTCGFIKPAREEAEETLKELLALKKKGRIGFLVVTGCWVQREGADLENRFPAVDAWISPFDESRIGQIVEQLKRNESPARFHATPSRHLILNDEVRHPLTLPHIAYLRIADGCDRFCSFCSIPLIRGRFVSKPLETLLEEARELARRGVRELVLIAQETTFWGSDLYGTPKIKELLTSLRDLSCFTWIRLLYSHPHFFSKELADLFYEKDEKIATAPCKTRILPYIDLPLQHSNDIMLKGMNRRFSKAETEELLHYLKETIPGLVLRSSFIAGFPGETEGMFEELLEFIRRWGFQRGGVFCFSPEKGTPAYDLPDAVPLRTRRERTARLETLMSELSEEYGQSTLGKSESLLIDGRELDENGEPIPDLFIGRSYADAPGIDPVVYVTGEDLPVGGFIQCEYVGMAGSNRLAVPMDSKNQRKKGIEQ